MDLISSKFKDQLKIITNDTDNISFTIDVEIFNNSDPNNLISVKPFIIDQLTIEQYFYYNVTDNVLLKAKFTIEDTFLLFNNIESLKCRIIYKFIDHDSGKINYDKDYIIKEYNVHIPKFNDLYKQYSNAQLFTDDKNKEIYLEQHRGLVVPLTLQLLEPLKYIFRKKIINTMFQNVKLSNVVLYICNKFGFTNIKYDKDLNNNIYQNIYIPIEYGKFKNVFDYLHKHYGIYSKGFSYYFQDDLLYLYQPFENKIDNQESILNIFKITKNSLGNLRKWHTIVDDDIWLIVDEDTYHKNISLMGLENDGTNQIFIKSDNLIDKHRVIEENDVIVNNNLVNISVDPNLSRINKDSITINYQKANMNLFYQSSLLAEKATNIIGVIWKFSIPYLIYAGQFVKFNYEKENEIICENGRVENVVYNFYRQHQVLSKSPIFGCICKIEIRVSNLSNL